MSTLETSSRQHAALFTLTKNGSLGPDGINTVQWTAKDDRVWFGELSRAIGTVVMGRETFDTLGRLPLRHRLNYILTRDPDRIPTTATSRPITLAMWQELALRQFCVIGGSEIYQLLWPEIDVLYISQHKVATPEGKPHQLDMSQTVLFDRRTDSPTIDKSIYLKPPYLHPKLAIRFDDSDADKHWMGDLPGLLFVRERKLLFGSTLDALGADFLANVDIACSTLYLTGAWWVDQEASQALVDAGVSNVVLNRRWIRQFLQIVSL
ncbi:dihydrofolate reductase [Candidatus Gracilibacteria bacterium]|nr:dihydrofolate reductase [Candidatus Gracilibacteria bacterium]MBP7057678.1 dihydrofolate reductase [Candidatus Gracilibacteria bacterium]